MKIKCNGENPLIKEEKIIINQIGENLMLFEIFYRVSSNLNYKNIKKISQWYNFKLRKIKDELEM